MVNQNRKHLKMNHFKKYVLLDQKSTLSKKEKINSKIACQRFIWLSVNEDNYQNEESNESKKSVTK